MAQIRWRSRQPSPAAAKQRGGGYGPNPQGAVCHATRQHGLPPRARQVLWVAVVHALWGGTPACQPPLKAHRSASCRSSKHGTSGAQMSQQLRPRGPGAARLSCPDPRLSPQC